MKRFAPVELVSGKAKPRPLFQIATNKSLKNYLQ